MNIFEEADIQLKNFIKHRLYLYHKLRNFDYGVNNRKNVSQISKYLTHRILYEYDIIDNLKVVDVKKKFTDEVIWRIYWRGYLENHKSIWSSYKNFNKLKYSSQVLRNAENGQTGIKCFDTWIEELREVNYLHNHSRMWFASIWIFTLRLPWQLGARLFMQHLLDGDAASNTLSWRWVAGMHTNNKPYIATNENIRKYTANRFKEDPINISNQINIIKKNQSESNTIPMQSNHPSSNFLFMFDNDLNIKNRSSLFNSYKKVYLFQNYLIEDNSRQSKKVFYFKQTLLAKVNKLIPNSEMINSDDINLTLKDLKSIDVVYPGLGNNLDLINNYSKRNGIKINFIYRDKDLFNWKFANYGFYKFKRAFMNTNNY